LCQHCYLDAGKKLDELHKEEIEKVIIESKELGATHVHFFGGEPFLRTDLEEICKFCHENNLTFDIATNAYNIDSKKVIWLKEFRAYLDINLLGPKDFHDRMTGVNGAFKKAFKAIKLLIKHKIGFEVVTCIMKNNIDLWLPLAENLVSIGVNRFFLTYFSKIGRGKKRYDLFCTGRDLERLEKIIQTFQKKYPKTRVTFEKCLVRPDLLQKDKKTKLSPCLFFNKKYGFLDCNGDVYPCFLLLRNKRFKLGNIHKSSFKKIWLKWTVEQLQKKRKISKHCFACKYYKYCLGGCPAYAQNKQNLDYRCILDNYIPFCPVKC
jgi:radical SAM protein with 4Fe4S-binding SPASM domain